MLSFTDDELQILMRATVSIRTDHRDRFLRDLANELMSRPDCPIAQAVNDLQRRWLDRSNPCSCTRPPMWRMSDSRVADAMTLRDVAFHESGHCLAIVWAFRRARWLPKPKPLLPVKFVRITDDDGNCFIGYLFVRVVRGSPRRTLSRTNGIADHR